MKSVSFETVQQTSFILDTVEQNSEWTKLPLYTAERTSKF